MEYRFYVLAYDIRDDRRRQKIARLCESLGDRVQGSVFEAYLTPAELDKLVQRAVRFLDEDEDNLRVYTLCAACRPKIATHGQGQVTPPPGLTIV